MSTSRVFEQLNQKDSTGSMDEWFISEEEMERLSESIMRHEIESGNYIATESWKNKLQSYNENVISSPESQAQFILSPTEISQLKTFSKQGDELEKAEFELKQNLKKIQKQQQDLKKEIFQVIECKDDELSDALTQKFKSLYFYHPVNCTVNKVTQKIEIVLSHCYEKEAVKNIFSKLLNIDKEKIQVRLEAQSMGDVNSQVFIILDLSYRIALLHSLSLIEKIDSIPSTYRP